jgi:hypothetical protein
MKKIVKYKCEVLADTFGTYKKGDKLEIEGTTARAIEKHKVIKILDKKGKDVTTENVKTSSKK